jgi:hypothetical protein
MRLAADDAEVDKIVFEVRALLKPQSALREPELVSRVLSEHYDAERWIREKAEAYVVERGLPKGTKVYRVGSTRVHGERSEY